MEGGGEWEGGEIGETGLGFRSTFQLQVTVRWVKCSRQSHSPWPGVTHSVAADKWQKLVWKDSCSLAPRITEVRVILQGLETTAHELNVAHEPIFVNKVLLEHSSPSRCMLSGAAFMLQLSTGPRRLKYPPSGPSQRFAESR